MINYVKVAEAEMKPDVYGGDNFDEHIPMWDMYWEGDMGGETSKNDIILSPELFPAGTKVIIKFPLCPECGEIQENCEIGDCNFDWKYWAECQYS